MPAMQWLDIVMLAVLAISVVVGLVRGFVFEVLSVLGWFVAYFAAQWFAGDVAPHLPVGEPGSRVNHAAAFAALFIGVLLCWALLSRLLRFLIHATPLSIPDRLLGGGFGAVRALVLLLVAATLVNLTPAANSPAWQASYGAGWLRVVFDDLRPVLPSQLKQHLPPAGTVR